MPKSIGVSFHKKVFVAVLIVAVALAFSPIMAGTSHAATPKFTLYKGQKIKIKYKPVLHEVGGMDHPFKGKVKYKSSNTKVLKIKMHKKNVFTMQAKKAGKSTFTISKKGFGTDKYKVTVKSSYPEGSEKKPISVVGSAWKTIKSADGVKQMKVKATVWKAEAARQMINSLEGEPNDGSSRFDTDYVNLPAVKAGKTLYLIKYDYQIINGYGSGTGVYFDNGLGDLSDPYYDSKWAVIPGTKWVKYSFFKPLANSVSDGVNGESGTFYNVILLANEYKELRSDNVGDTGDLQWLGLGGGAGYNDDLTITGCVTVKLQ